MLVVFSAEWCVECKIIDRNVFNTREVQRRLQGIMVVHADMTRPTKDNSALMKRFDVIGPPTIF
ncbi:thioredoxin family protein, partial [Providencia stuartii]|uniref:thioredoxin family protein n=1 Tax=Providencia stuartii TaxID=588 RepID=UPI0034DE8E85